MSKSGKPLSSYRRLFLIGDYEGLKTLRNGQISGWAFVIFSNLESDSLYDRELNISHAIIVAHFPS